MRKTLTAVAALAMIAGAAQADVYSDNTGWHVTGGDFHDFFFQQSFDHLDIAQVEVTNDASFLYFDITVVGDLDATNWGKYLIGMDTGRVAGTNTGGWTRNIDWGSGITDFVGSWADDGGSGAGGELHAWDGAAWNLTDATYLAGTEIQGDDSNHAAGTQRIAVSLAALGLSVGDVVLFDVASTGGGDGDPGVDHLSRADFSTDDWGNGSTSGDYLAYTITPVPAPASAALLGLGGFAAMRRRR